MKLTNITYQYCIILLAYIETGNAELFSDNTGGSTNGKIHKKCDYNKEQLYQIDGVDSYIFLIEFPRTESGIYSVVYLKDTRSLQIIICIILVIKYINI